MGDMENKWYFHLVITKRQMTQNDIRDQAHQSYFFKKSIKERGFSLTWVGIFQIDMISFPQEFKSRKNLSKLKSKNKLYIGNILYPPSQL